MSDKSLQMIQYISEPFELIESRADSVYDSEHYASRRIYQVQYLASTHTWD